MKKLNVFGVFKRLTVTMIVFLAIFVYAPDAKANIIVFNNINGGGVWNGGSSPSFSIDVDTFITEIKDYHYNGGSGVTPGTIGIENIGTWTAHSWAELAPTWNPLMYWIVEPNVLLTPGTYKIIDSDPGTWSTNYTPVGYGFTIVTASDTPPVPIPSAVWLLGSGMLGLIGLKRFRKN